MAESYRLEPIGHIESCFKEKFLIPRQPGLVAAAEGWLRLKEPFNVADTVRELAGFSHIWLVFIFHAVAEQEWSPTVRPPRLGGNKRVGVFASRSPFRPNRLGQSVVRLLEVDTSKGVALRLGGIDLLDGTPVVDIKPYLPYVEAVTEAHGGFAPEAPKQRDSVCFTPAAERACATAEAAGRSELRELIMDLLRYDARPGYRQQRDEARLYVARLDDFEIRWRYLPDQVVVEGLEPVVHSG